MIVINKKTAKEFKNFAIVGIISTAVNYLIFYSLVHFFGLHYLISSSFRFITGIFVSYGLNRIYTFSDPSIDMKNEFAAYVVVCIFSLLLSLASLWVFVELFGINPLIGNVLAIGVSTVSNFLGLKTFVYSN